MIHPLSSPPLLLLLLLLHLLHTHLALSQSAAVSPTTIHFFPRTSCNRGTSLSYTTVADLYDDNTCHTTPVGTEALYIDGIAEGCAVQTFSDSACSPSALLSGDHPITPGTCQFYGAVGNSIGAWMGVCGASVSLSPGSSGGGAMMMGSSTISTGGGVAPTGNVNGNGSVVMTGTVSGAMTVTMSALGNVNGTVVIGAGGGGGKTAAATSRKVQTSTSTNPPTLQGSAGPGVGVANGGVASGKMGLFGRGRREGENWDTNWVRWMVVKALLAMGGVEVFWGFV